MEAGAKRLAACVLCVAKRLAACVLCVAVCGVVGGARAGWRRKALPVRSPKGRPPVTPGADPPADGRRIQDHAPRSHGQSVVSSPVTCRAECWFGLSQPRGDLDS